LNYFLLTKTFLKMKLQDKQIDYSNQNIYCGVDVHKKRWHATVCTQHTIQKTFSFDKPFVQTLKAHLAKHYPGGNYMVAYEAGFSGFWAYKALEELGLKVVVVNPADIPTTDKERKQKTDKRDSRKIAVGLRAGELRPIYVPSNRALEDRSVIRERWSIARSERRVKNQIKSHLMFYGLDIPEDLDNRHWSRRFVGWLEQVQQERNDSTLKLQIDRLLKMRGLQVSAIKELRKMSNLDRFDQLFRLLRSVPGVGLLTAMILIGELINIKRFDSISHLCSYVGLIPTSNNSGPNEKWGEMTTRKNNRVLSTLVQASWVAIRNDVELTLKYEAYRKRMTGQKAIIRIARILLKRIRRVWITQTRYQKAEC
jgi:transposase